jgi:hypothetical protein
MPSLKQHSDKPLKLVRQIVDTIYEHPLMWVSVDEVAGIAGVAVGREFKAALGFAVSTDLIVVDDDQSPRRVRLTPNGMALAGD